MNERRSEIGRNTFWIESPRDMLDKLNYDFRHYWQLAPHNLVEKTYALLNCAVTGWQLKDWVWTWLEERGELSRLFDLEGKKFLGCKSYGEHIAEQHPVLTMCFQMATSTKHFRVTSAPKEDIQTIIEKDSMRDIHWVTFDDWQMPAADVMMLVTGYWTDRLQKLGIYNETGFSPSGDTAVG